MANRGFNLENPQLSRNQVTTGLRVVFTVAILYLLLNTVGARALKQAISQTDWAWLIVMYSMTLCFIVINSAMLKQLLGKVGLEINLRRVVLANALSTMYSLVLPSDALAGIVKWANLSAATGDKPRVLSAMVFAKVALALAPLFFGTLALALHNPFSDVPLSAIAGGLCIFVVIGTAVILNPKSGTVVDRGINGLISFLPGFTKKKLSALVASLKHFRLLSHLDHLQILLYSAAAFGFGIAGFYCAVRATGESVAVTALLWVSLALFITRLLPITISNLGVRESIIVYAFAAYGVAPGPALLIGLLMFSNTIFIAIGGALYQSALAMGWLTWSSNDAEV
jgi:uncharacterized membrane protein YbhN (UPF0104 family)